jgi:hypothetical protein
MIASVKIIQMEPDGGRHACCRPSGRGASPRPLRFDIIDEKAIASDQ